MPKPRDARADFSKSTKDKIREKYNDRCAICLQKLPHGGRQCAHLFDASPTGAKQVSGGANLRVVDTEGTQVEVAIYMGVISPGYQRSSPENGMVRKLRRVLCIQKCGLTYSECPTCHMAFFTSEHIALSPPPQVLEYIVDYLRVTDAADRKPLHEVCIHPTT